MRLFLEHGFEATTLDDIAAAADVSRRSLFHYFGSKEEIVFSTKADFPALVAEAIGRRPVEEPLLDMVENAFVELAARHISEPARNLARLIQDTPALSAGDQAKYEKVERVLAKALAEQKGRSENDLECRVTATTAIGILKLSTQAWLAEPNTGPDTFGKAAFAALRQVVSQTSGGRE
ncbi:TetR/AcrR family transcriptional regulator [Novosphingobium kaempferiae]|uniref:TetR/AcrR family transcriptional regulator n=1 Tax=Novosphingobium kaempferiae TaxID=2896849 RepID=UPI001E42846C|nr:TetR/AcrR family transcriptional regulator [Novosphingobium kaempferiae]